ncbi:MAG: ligase-associated DNA damage response endonuclease PdeM [Bacteroidota bacterium]
MNAISITVGATPVELSSLKAIYLPTFHCLVVADVHLGKAEHFQKNNIALSNEAHDVDYARLTLLINQYHPKRVIFLGDLFHSKKNSSTQQFKIFRQQFTCSFELVEGNHDIMDASVYKTLDIAIIGEQLILDNLLLTHEPLDRVEEGMCNVFGHIHPGFSLRGKGLQSLSLPCFAVTHNQLYMPAFGTLTGLYKLRLKAGDIYVIVGDAIAHVPLTAKV